MSDAVTDDHYKLVDAILIELGINPREKFIADFRRRPVAQLIAGSAERAVAVADSAISQTKTNEIHKS